jgi:hypothetical protein
MGYAALTHPTQEFGVIKSMILREVRDLGFANHLRLLYSYPKQAVNTTNEP